VSLLVVEDDPDSREMLAATFAGCGAKVRAVASAAQARDALERAAPDVLVSDIGLPGENGYTLIRKVRAADAERGRRIPALALTAFTRPEERQEAIDAGFGASAEARGAGGRGRQGRGPGAPRPLMPLR